MSADASEVFALAADLGKAGGAAVALARQVIAKSAHDIEGSAKNLAAVDTGMMRNSIGVDISSTGLTAVIGPTASYAPYVEFGTARQHPQPFMGPATEMHESSFIAAMAKIPESLLGG